MVVALLFTQDQQLCLFFQLQVLSAIPSLLVDILRLCRLHITAVLYQVLGNAIQNIFQYISCSVASVFYQCSRASIKGTKYHL